MPPYFCLTLTVASKTVRRDDLVSSWATTCATIYSRLKQVGDVANTYVLSAMWNVSNLQGKISKDWSSSFTDHEDVFSRISLALFTHRFELDKSNTNREKWKPQNANSVWFSFDDYDGKGKTKVFTRKASHGLIPLR
ncbi:hypothetical protein ACFE04_021511 [Oxalis oulophora]